MTWRRVGTFATLCSGLVFTHCARQSLDPLGGGSGGSEDKPGGVAGVAVGGVSGGSKGGRSGIGGSSGKGGRGGTTSTGGRGGSSGRGGTAGEGGEDTGTGGMGGEPPCGGTFVTAPDGEWVASNQDLEKLRGASVIDGGLGILHADDLSALHCLTRIEGWLEVGSVGTGNLVGLEELTEVTQSLVVEWVESLQGLESLTVVGGELWVESALAMTDASALGALEEVGGDFHLGNMPNLTSLRSLSNLVSVGGLTIQGFPRLGDLEGLHNVEAVHGSVWIQGACFFDRSDVETCLRNDALTNLRGLRGLRSITGLVSVTDNPSLPACEVDWLFQSVGPENIGGTVTNSDNDGAADCAP